MDLNTPSSIQQLAINQLLFKQLNFKSFFIAGQTGTGKTLAYLLPILHNLKQTELNTKCINTIANRP
jgi:superfamily II DNA/RNA helicase